MSKNYTWLKVTGPGVGDSLFLTPLLEQAKESMRIIANHPAVFKNNPHVLDLLPYNNYQGVEDHEILDLARVQSILVRRDNKHHLAALLAEAAGLPLPDPDNPQLQLHFSIDDPGKLKSTIITITPGTSSGVENKNWYWSRWEGLIERLKEACPQYDLVQVGLSDAPKLNVSSHELGLDIETLTNTLARARLHITTATDSLFLATAVKVKCIVIYGGSMHPNLVGFKTNTNIYYNPRWKCGPCWQVKPCHMSWREGTELRKPCMEKISVDFVFEQIKKELGQWEIS